MIVYIVSLIALTNRHFKRIGDVLDTFYSVDEKPSLKWLDRHLNRHVKINIKIKRGK